MYVCMYVCMCIYIYIYIYILFRVYVYLPIGAHLFKAPLAKARLGTRQPKPPAATQATLAAGGWRITIVLHRSRHRRLRVPNQLSRSYC